MNKHTAGPWSTAFGYRPQINSADGRCVAWAETLGDISHTSEEHANAQLIASAPELLEALKDLMAMRHKCMIPNDGNWWDEKAIKAINKAEGR